MISLVLGIAGLSDMRYVGAMKSKRALALESITTEDEGRFNRYVDRSGGPDACWPWLLKGVAPRGYGRFKCQGSTVLAHRIALFLSTRSIDHDSCVLHSCDNPTCCNPKHLRLGDRADNGEDMALRNRISGARNPFSKLTAEDVTLIRARLNLGDSQAEIARSYGVTRFCIHNIASGRGWCKV